MGGNILKNTLVLCIIASLLCVSVIPSTGSIDEKESHIIEELDITPFHLETEISRTVSILKSTYKGFNPSVIINETGFHPSVSGDKNGRFFAGFEVGIGEDYYPVFWYSLDSGTSWDEAGYFAESLGAQYPDVDSNENGFYGTFSSNENNDGEIWLIIAEDLSNIGCLVFDWSYYCFRDFQHLSISCHTNEFWNYGGIAGTCHYCNGWYDLEGCPFITYSNIIDYLPVEGYLRSDFAIDEVTGYAYAVYDSIDKPNLLVCKYDFDEWIEGRHPYIGSWYVGDDVTNLRYPSIEAYDDNVVIVCEGEGDVACFFSNNGFTSVSKSIVVESANYPEVKVTFDGEPFLCSYISNGTLNRKISTDGGSTWADEKQIEDSQISEFSTHDLCRGIDGIYSIWQGTGGINFGQVYNILSPELDIIASGGPVGLKFNIKNVGDAPATNLDFSLQVTGGILGLININVGGNKEVLDVNEEIVVNSGVIIGFGPILITFEVSCNELPTIAEYERAFQIFIFTMF